MARDLLHRAVAALARREHSRAELARKLGRAVEADARTIDATLDRLQADGVLSDERFAAALARSRSARFGSARIRQELRQHQLPDDLMRATLAQLSDTEFGRARAIWQRKFGRPAADQHERARQMRFLAQRGFATDVIIRVVKGQSRPD